jgi:hypothetical protein
MDLKRTGHTRRDSYHLTYHCFAWCEEREFSISSGHNVYAGAFSKHSVINECFPGNQRTGAVVAYKMVPPLSRTRIATSHVKKN